MQDQKIEIYLEELHRLNMRVQQAVVPSSVDGTVPVEAAERFFHTVVAFGRHIVMLPSAEAVMVNLLGYIQRTSDSAEVRSLNDQAATAFRQIGEAIRQSAVWPVLQEARSDRKWLDPWAPFTASVPPRLSAAEVIDRLVTQTYTGPSFGLINNVLRLLTLEEGVLSSVTPYHESLDAVLTPFFVEVRRVLDRLRTLFEFEPPYNGSDAAQWVMSILASYHPELNGRDRLGDRMALRVYRQNGMPLHRVNEVREYCAQLEYHVRRTIGDAPIDTSSQQPPGVAELASLASALESGAGFTNGQRIIRARERFNAAWRRKFTLKDIILQADENAVERLYRPVNDEEALELSVGALAIVAVDGGLKQEVLDRVSPRQPGERSLKHMERILREQLSLTADDAAALMAPLHQIMHLRNGTPSFHPLNEDGRKAFDKIDHPLPIQNPTACWDDICTLYTTALERIINVLDSPSAASGVSTDSSEDGIVTP